MNSPLSDNNDPDLEIGKYTEYLQPHKLGPHLKQTLKENIPVQKEFRNIIKDIICNDVKTKEFLKGQINAVEHERFKWFLKSILKGTFSIVTFFAGILGTLLVLWLSNKLGLQ